MTGPVTRSDWLGDEFSEAKMEWAIRGALVFCPRSSSSSNTMVIDLNSNPCLSIEPCSPPDVPHPVTSYAYAMDDDHRAITNIVAMFAERIDSHDFAAIGDLFTHMTYRSNGIDDSVMGKTNLAQFYERVLLEMNERWAGDPEDAHTVGHKHVFTNLIVEFDEDRATATCRYYGTVFAFSDRKPYQPRWAGRYHDRFQRIDGEWYIVDRLQTTDYPRGYRPASGL